MDSTRDINAVANATVYSSQSGCLVNKRKKLRRRQLFKTTRGKNNFECKFDHHTRFPEAAQPSVSQSNPSMPVASTTIQHLNPQSNVASPSDISMHYGQSSCNDWPTLLSESKSWQSNYTIQLTNQKIFSKESAFNRERNFTQTSSQYTKDYEITNESNAKDIDVIKSPHKDMSNEETHERNNDNDKVPDAVPKKKTDTAIPEDIFTDDTTLLLDLYLGEDLEIDLSHPDTKESETDRANTQKESEKENCNPGLATRVIEPNVSHFRIIMEEDTMDASSVEEQLAAKKSNHQLTCDERQIQIISLTNDSVKEKLISSSEYLQDIMNFTSPCKNYVQNTLQYSSPSQFNEVKIIMDDDCDFDHIGLIRPNDAYDSEFCARREKTPPVSTTKTDLIKQPMSECDQTYDKDFVNRKTPSIEEFTSEKLIIDSGDIKFTDLVKNTTHEENNIKPQKCSEEIYAEQLSNVTEDEYKNLVLKNQLGTNITFPQKAKDFSVLRHLLKTKETRVNENTSLNIINNKEIAKNSTNNFLNRLNETDQISSLSPKVHEKILKTPLCKLDKNNTESLLKQTSTISKTKALKPTTNKSEKNNSMLKTTNALKPRSKISSKFNLGNTTDLLDDNLQNKKDNNNNKRTNNNPRNKRETESKKVNKEKAKSSKETIRAKKIPENNEDMLSTDPKLVCSLPLIKVRDIATQLKHPKNVKDAKETTEKTVVKLLGNFKIPKKKAAEPIETEAKVTNPEEENTNRPKKKMPSAYDRRPKKKSAPLPLEESSCKRRKIDKAESTATSLSGEAPTPLLKVSIPFHLLRPAIESDQKTYEQAWRHMKTLQARFTEGPERGWEQGAGDMGQDGARPWRSWRRHGTPYPSIPTTTLPAHRHDPRLPRLITEEQAKMRHSNVLEKKSQPNVPEKNRQPNVPQKNRQPNVPQKNRQPNVPQNNTHRNVLEKNTQPNVPQKNRQPNVPQKNRQPNVPQNNTQLNVPQKNTQLNVPQKNTQLNVPKKNTQLNMPQKNTLLDVPKKNTLLDVPQKNTQLYVPKKNTQLSMPKKNTQPNLPQKNTHIKEANITHLPTNLNVVENIEETKGVTNVKKRRRSRKRNRCKSQGVNQNNSIIPSTTLRSVVIAVNPWLTIGY